jgi:hypothetical protein
VEFKNFFFFDTIYEMEFSKQNVIQNRLLASFLKAWM